MLEKTRRIRKFDLEQAIALATKRPPEGIENVSSRVELDSFGPRDWYGATFEEAIQMSYEGYHKGTLKLQRKLGKLARIRTATRPRPRWGPEGSSVDIGRFMTGEPDDMVEVVRGQRPSPVIKIGIERAIAAATSTGDIEATGASVLAVVEALRTAGIPSEVWVTFTVDNYTMRNRNIIGVSHQVLIQQAGRPIDMDRLAFWTVHPAALRRFAFATYEHEPKNVRETMGFRRMGGYGRPTQLSRHEHDFDEIVPAREYEAKAWILDVIRRRVSLELREDEIL